MLIIFFDINIVESIRIIKQIFLISSDLELRILGWSDKLQFSITQQNENNILYWCA